MKTSLMLLVAFRLTFSFSSLPSKMCFCFLILVKEGQVFSVLMGSLELSDVCSVVFSWPDKCLVFETYKDELYF